MFGKFEQLCRVSVVLCLSASTIACGSASGSKVSKPVVYDGGYVVDSRIDGNLKINSWHFGNMNYATVIEKKLTGKNVLVAVVDTGIDRDSRFFEGNIHEASTRIFRGDFEPNYDDELGHGTSMSSLIAGYDEDTGQLIGIAPNAELLIIAADNQFSSDGTFLLSDIGYSIDYAVEHGADIINLSLGNQKYSISSPDVRAAANATEQGVIIVNSTGNNGNEKDDSPNNLSSFAGMDMYNDLFVAVTATDKSNNIASFASPCDVYDPNFCIAAPGRQVTQIDLDGIDTGSGTSQATAIVSGSLAILKEYFPHLTNEETLEILLKTAKDLGKPGVDRIYGVGLVDLERALQPVGQMVLANGQEFDENAENYVRVDSSVMGLALSENQAFEDIAITDEYRRQYEIDMRAGVVEDEDALTSDALKNQDRIAFRLDGFDLAGFQELRFVQGDLKNAFDEGSLHYVDRSWNANPYAHWLDASFGLSYGEARDWSVNYAQNFDEDAQKRFLQIGYQSQISNQLSMGLALSYLKEDGAVLNSEMTGIYGEIDQSQTLAAHLGINWQSASYSAFARASLGKSMVEFQSDNGIISSMDDVTSSTFAVGLGKDNLLLAGDRLDFALSQSLRLETGVANLNADLAGGGHVDLAPNGREMAFELGYNVPIAKNIAVESNFVALKNPNHDENADWQKALSFGVEVSF